MSLFNILVLLNGLTLSVYGLSCLSSHYMVLEFERFGLPQFRVLIGTLEIFGGLGLVVGLYEPFIGMLAAAGLSILLLCGFAVRVKVRDGILKSTPALLYFILNSYLAIAFFSKIN